MQRWNEPDLFGCRHNINILHVIKDLLSMYKILTELVNVSQKCRKFELVEFIQVRNIGADHLMDH